MRGEPLRRGEAAAIPCLSLLGTATAGSLAQAGAETWALLAMTPPASFLSAWAVLWLLNIQRPLRVPSALLAMAPVGTLYLSQLPYLGFILLPFEVLLSGLLLAFRSRMETRKALLAAGLAQLAALACVHPGYVLDMLG